MRSESDRASEAALSLWTLSKIASVSGIFFGLRFQNSAHFVAHSIEHAADRVLVRQFCGGVILVLDQHLAHGFGGQTQVFKKPLELRIGLRMRLNQFANVTGKLRMGVFGSWSAGARRIGNDPARVVLLDASGNGVPRPAKDRFREACVSAEIVHADARFKRPTFRARKFASSITQRRNHFWRQLFHHSPP